MVPGDKQVHLLPPPPQPPQQNLTPSNTSALENDVKPRSLSSLSKPALVVDGAEEDSSLRLSRSLTREEVLRRRSRRIKQLGRYYQSQYWALMDELKAQYREYYWKFGKSPFKKGDEASGSHAKGSGENHSDFRSNGGGGGGDNGMRKCKLTGCKSKAMALTSYCHNHILSDSKQTLYKPCSYVIKSASTGRNTCGKPVLRAAVPSLCTIHLPKAQRHVSQALKKAGLNCSSSSKPAPKFHVIIAEYIHQIQNKRREAQNAAMVNDIIKDENGG